MERASSSWRSRGRGARRKLMYTEMRRARKPGRPRVRGARRCIITLRLTTAEMRQVKANAAAEGMTVSSYLRKVIVATLEGAGHEPAADGPRGGRSPRGEQAD